MGTHSRLRRRHRLEGYLAAILALIVCGTASVAGAALPQPVLVGDLNTTPGEGSDPGLSGFFSTIGSQTLFDAVTPTTGRELWRTDGTAEGTRLVADLWPGRESAFPQRFGTVGGLLFFSATDGATDALWRSDGSAAGTWRVSGLSPSSQFHFASAPVDVGGIAYFTAFNDGAASSGAATERQKEPGSCATSSPARRGRTPAGSLHLATCCSSPQATASWIASSG